MLRQAVVLVGGLGTRLGTLTERMPKPMLPVAGGPFLDILLRNIARHGFEEILLLARHHAQTIRDHYGSGQIGGARIRVCEERERAGTAGALREVASDLDAHFLLSNGDSFFDVNYLALAQIYRQKAPVIALALREVPDAARYGQVTLGADGRVVDYSEKSPGAAHSGLINGGVYVVSREILGSIGPDEVSLETDVMPALVAAGRVTGMPFDGYFLDIGLPETYAQAQVDLPRQQRRKVVFLDIDTLAGPGAALADPTVDLTLRPDAVKAIRRGNDAGRLVIGMARQADEGETELLRRRLNRQLQDFGAHVDGLCVLPPPDTATEGDRSQRRRSPVEQVMAAWGADRAGGVMVGGDPSDRATAEALGLRVLPAEGIDLAGLFAEEGI